jgi:hypothetical protein
MSRAKVKKSSSHYLLVGSTVAGECFLERLRLLPTRTTAAVSRLPVQSVA